MNFIKNIITNWFGYKPTNKTGYRIVKENVYNEVALELITRYWIEKKIGISWGIISPIFEDYDTCLKFFSKYQEYAKNKGLLFDYL
jgi:hypothetical protein